MYISGVIAAFVVGFLMLYSSRMRRLRQEGQASVSRAVFDSLIGAAIGATLSWLMVAACIVMLLFSKRQV
jgi:hypothetical protein